jgi:hypothetical protein
VPAGMSLPLALEYDSVTVAMPAAASLGIRTGPAKK